MIPAISASVYAACASASGREQLEGKKKRVGGFPIPPSKSGARRLVRSSSQLSSGAACTRNNTIILRESAVCPRPPQPAAVPSKEDAVQLRRPPAAAHHIHRPSPVAQKKRTFFFRPHLPPVTSRAASSPPCTAHRTAGHATPRGSRRDRDTVGPTTARAPSRSRTRVYDVTYGGGGDNKGGGRWRWPHHAKLRRFCCFFFLVCLSACLVLRAPPSSRWTELWEAISWVRDATAQPLLARYTIPSPRKSARDTTIRFAAYLTRKYTDLTPC